MKEIELGKRTVRLPESWDEMTHDQYWTYMLLFSAVMAGERAILEAEKTFFSFLIGWNGADWTRMADRETADRLWEIFLEWRQWCGLQRLPDTECINLMPVWTGQLGRYKGPQDWIADMNWGDFCECLDILMLLGGDDRREQVERLARLVYRLPDVEEPDRVLEWHCVAFMQSVVHAMSSGPVEINGRDVDLSVVFKKSAAKGDGTGLTGVTFEVAESGVFGDFKGVRDTGVWEVMLYLYKCRKSKEKERK